MKVVAHGICCSHVQVSGNPSVRRCRERIADIYPYRFTYSLGSYNPGDPHESAHYWPFPLGEESDHIGPFYFSSAGARGAFN
jgi:hypothetical protein